MKQQARKHFSIVVATITVFLTGCNTAPKPGTHAPRKGDEIVAAGQFFHTGTPVVLWLDQGGYDAYRVERRFAPFEKSDWKNSSTDNKELTTPNRYGLRGSGLTWLEREEVRVVGTCCACRKRSINSCCITMPPARAANVSKCCTTAAA